MSFVGSTGFPMEGSGLETAFETVYGKNSVTYTFSGRPFPGHIVVISLSIQLFG